MKNKYTTPEIELLSFKLTLDVCEDVSGIVNPGTFPGADEEGDDDILID